MTRFPKKSSQVMIFPGEAAGLKPRQELQLPLYSVRALLELPAAYSAESMEGALWQEDGSITYFSMPLLTSVPSQSEIPATLYMQVTQYDPFSQSVLATWQAQEDISLPMTPMLAEKTYLPTPGNIL